MSDRCRFSFLQEITTLYPKPRAGSVVHVLADGYLRTYSATTLNLLSTKTTLGDYGYTHSGALAVGKGRIFYRQNTNFMTDRLASISTDTGATALRSSPAMDIQGLHTILDIDESTFFVICKKYEEPITLTFERWDKATASIIDTTTIPVAAGPAAALESTDSGNFYAFFTATGDVVVGTPVGAVPVVVSLTAGTATQARFVGVLIPYPNDQYSELFTYYGSTSQHRTSAEYSAIYGIVGSTLRQASLTDYGDGFMTRYAFRDGEPATMYPEIIAYDSAELYSTAIIGDKLFLNFDGASAEYGTAEIIALHRDTWDLLGHSPFPPAGQTLQAGFLAAEWE